MIFISTRSVAVATALTVITIMVFGCQIPRKMPTAPAKQESCFHCHDDLSETLPEAHAAVATNQARSCLKCHTEEGSASPMGWMAHAGHYSKDEFEGDCFSCHLQGNVRVIDQDPGQEPDKGPLTKEQALRLTPFFRSWAASEYLDFRHNRHKVTCQPCHGTYSPEKRASKAQCLTCHESYEHVAALTANLEPNPHESHYGKIRCTLCHKAHEASELYCNKCHDFELQMP
jgi:hypothetical protein